MKISDITGTACDECIDYILPIKLQCKYMEKIPTSNIRSYDAACAAEGICP